MGLGTSKKKLLTNEEIEKSASGNPTLEKLYLYNRSYEGYISKRDFEYIFGKKVDQRITNKLFKIFASERDRFYYEDLKYLYAMFQSKNYQAKLNFITELIFSPSNSSKLVGKYVNRVELIFGKGIELKNKLLAGDFLSKLSSDKGSKHKITKENFAKNMDLYYQNYFLKFDFMKRNLPSSKTEYKYKMENSCICDCYAVGAVKKNGDLSDSSHDLNEYIYEKMETEFRRLEKLNDGLFSIGLFEKMLNEIRVNSKLIQFIVAYLKRKIQRNFLDFKTFKSFLLACLGSNEEKIKLLFEILAYPKENMDKKVFFGLVNSGSIYYTNNPNTKSPSNSNDELTSIFNNYFAKTDLISWNDFYSLFSEYSSFMYPFLTCIERINSIPYIYFKIRPDDKRMEKICIEIIMKGEKNLKKYIEKLVLGDDDGNTSKIIDFYCVNYGFWEKWCDYVEWTGKKKGKEENSEIERIGQRDFDFGKSSDSFQTNSTTTNYNSQTSKNYHFYNSIKPKIQNEKILGEYSNKLASGLVYFKDYVVLPAKIYDLFVRWYMKTGSDIKVKRIYYQKSENSCMTDCGDIAVENASPMFDDKKSLFIHEFEVYPVFMKYFSFEELYKNVNEFSFDQIKDLLNKLFTETKLNLSRLFSLSRKSTFQDIKSYVEKAYSIQNISGNKTNIWIYYKSNFYKLAEEDLVSKTLESERIDDFCLVVLETMKENQWMGDQMLGNSEKRDKKEDYIKQNDSLQKSEIKDRQSLNSINDYNIYSDKFRKIKPITDPSLIGISNIGNTCYMNSILQILLNLKEIREVFLTKNFKYSINYNNKYGYKGKVITEFLKLLNDKWGDKKEFDIKALKPVTFKDVIGEVNEQFKNSEQQDAQEFFNFLLDVLHEELNLIDEKEYIPNPEKYDYTDEELASEYWANNMRRNASFIHSLFLGQLKSNLICEKCETKKTTFETFSNLILPISQKKTITLEIVLFRIPFTFKAYYLNKFVAQHGNLKKEDLALGAEFDNVDIRKSLSIIRRESFDNFNEDTLNIVDEKLKESDAENKESETTDDNSNIKSDNEVKLKSNGVSSTNSNLYLSRLATSIPLKIILEVDIRSKVGKIIEMIKNIKELELEITVNENNKGLNQLSDLILMTTDGTFIDPELKVDECFQNNQLIYVHEVLNSRGIIKLMSNESLLIKSNLHFNSNEKLTNTYDLNYQKQYKMQSENMKTSNGITNSVYYYNNIVNDIISINSESYARMNKPIALDKFLSIETNPKMEYLVSIIHRRPSEVEDYYLFRKNTNIKLDFFANVILVNNLKSFNARFLYEYIWEKYEYVLNDPNKLREKVWWDQKIGLEGVNKEHIKNYDIKFCSPFVIKILTKDNHICVKCPWYRFCTGCILNPFNEDDVIITPAQVIVVEWCYNIAKQEMNESNIRLILNHETVKSKIEDKSVKTLDECINLFLEKEYLEGEDQQIHCGKCKTHQNFYKKYDFDRLPPILILSIKRFKFAKMYKKKIDNLIDFPIYDLYLKGNSDCGNNKYDLYGIINHSGHLSAGHYTAIYKNQVNNKWIKCDDSNCYEINENNIITSGAYILIYKLKDDISTDYYRLMNYFMYDMDIQIDMMLKNELHQNYCQNVFVVGEPVKTPYGKGYVCEEIIRNGYKNKIVHVKLRYGSAYLNEKSVRKEINLKITNPNFIKEVQEEVKKKNESLIPKNSIPKNKSTPNSRESFEEEKKREIRRIGDSTCSIF